MASSRDRRLNLVLLVALAAIAIGPAPAFAYVGPGAGLSLVGSVVGLVSALFTAIGLILVWPIRALLKRMRGVSTGKIDAAAAHGVASALRPPSN